MHDQEFEEERLDEIIPRILEKLQKNQEFPSKTYKEHIEELCERKRNQLKELSDLSDVLLRQAESVDKKAQMLFNELTLLLAQSKMLSGEFTPNDIINGGNDADKR